MALDTLANIKTRLGITTSADDTVLGMFQESADRFIERFCGREFSAGTITETHPGTGIYVILKNFPLASVVSVKVDSTRNFGSETALPAGAWTAIPEIGVVQSLGGPFLPAAKSALLNQDRRFWYDAPGVVQVVYTVSDNQPGDLREAYSRLVGHWYRLLKTETAANFRNLDQQRLGESFVLYRRLTESIPADVSELLRPFRVPGI